jgi:hypothetical protein
MTKVSAGASEPKLKRAIQNESGRVLPISTKYLTNFKYGETDDDDDDDDDKNDSSMSPTLVLSSHPWLRW